MTTKQEFVDEVRSWIGTTFHHEGRVKGAGVDCVGVVAGSCKSLGLPVIDMGHYPRNPIHGIFEREIDSQTIPASLEALELADLMKFRFKTEPQHLAVVTQLFPIIRITHAFLHARMCVETDFDDFWKDRLVGVRRIEALT